MTLTLQRDLPLLSHSYDNAIIKQTLHIQCTAYTFLLSLHDQAHDCFTGWQTIFTVDTHIYYYTCILLHCLHLFLGRNIYISGLQTLVCIYHLGDSASLNSDAIWISLCALSQLQLKAVNVSQPFLSGASIIWDTSLFNTLYTNCDTMYSVV